MIKSDLNIDMPQGAGVPVEGLSLVESPLTAGFQAAAAFFNFLSTPEGQKVVEQIGVLDAFFVNKVHEVFVKIHDTLMTAK